MEPSHPSQQRLGEFYTEVVLPALAERLDSAFPEFGWKRDARGWVATNEEMTHRALGVRAERVVAHGPAPRGFLVHGGEAVLWTAYLNSGFVPRGEAFASIVRQIAERAGVETSPIERPRPRDRRAELLDSFATLCRTELRGNAGAQARAYLEERGLPADAIDQAGLGVVPRELFTKNALEAAGYSELEVAQSGVLADGRWPGRLCGAWRDERGTLRTLWARSLSHSDSSSRYLYLTGASRSGLPPYGLSDVLRLPQRSGASSCWSRGSSTFTTFKPRDSANVAAVGGARLNPDLIPRLGRLGFETIVLAFDNDAPGREGTSRAVGHASRPRRRQSYVCSSPSSSATPRTPTRSCENMESRSSAPSSSRPTAPSAGTHSNSPTASPHSTTHPRAGPPSPEPATGSEPCHLDPRSNKKTQSDTSPTNAATRTPRSNGLFALDSGMARNAGVASDW